MTQINNQLIHQGVVIGREPGNPDFCKISDGSFVVSAFDSQGTTNVGDKVSVFKTNTTYYVGQKIQ